ALGQKPGQFLPGRLRLEQQAVPLLLGRDGKLAGPEIVVVGGCQALAGPLDVEALALRALPAGEQVAPLPAPGANQLEWVAQAAADGGVENRQGVARPAFAEDGPCEEVVGNLELGLGVDLARMVADA